MRDAKTLEQRCYFKTKRLRIRSWTACIDDISPEKSFTEIVSGILTTEVTKALPPGWQNINSMAAAQKWIENRAEESSFFTVQLRETGEIIGFVFLYEAGQHKSNLELRFGYLLSDTSWGKGLGTELVKGLVSWCREAGDINSISGGVDSDNIASMRILEKCGFSPVPPDNAPENVIFYEWIFK